MRPPDDPSGSATAPAGATILVVEDRREVRELVMRTLAEQGFELSVATTGPDAVELALASRPDLVVLDLGLPAGDGLEALRELRGRGFDRPVLVLTARDGVPDRVAGLDAGADDYMGKPFDCDELAARVRALLRRGGSGPRRLRVGELECDPLTREVHRDGRQLVLTQREYALLEFLMRRAGEPVTREEIASEVWKTRFDPENNIIDVYVSYLRQKLTIDGEPQLLHTVRGVGYVLEERPSR